jgi:hypothetical protein
LHAGGFHDIALSKRVDGRDEPGHDETDTVIASTREAIQSCHGKDFWIASSLALLANDGETFVAGYIFP